MTTTIATPAHLHTVTAVQRANAAAETRYAAAVRVARRRFADYLGLSRVSDIPPGMVLYRGPSRLDGASIAVVLTGIKRSSSNAKTGSMLQTWIIRSDVHPHDAVKTGDDSAVCGDCPHRPTKGGTCYVSHGASWMGVGSLWRAFERGRYPNVPPAEAARILRGTALRIGSYGDPAAAPVATWRPLLGTVGTHTGYTHQAHRPDTDRRTWGFLQASADTETEAQVLRSAGWRVFRVGAVDSAPVSGEIECASTARDLSCLACGLCTGGKADVWIAAHGGAKARVTG